jgi:hypothetical protein
VIFSLIHLIFIYVSINLFEDLKLFFAIGHFKRLTFKIVLIETPISLSIDDFEEQLIS